MSPPPGEFCVRLGHPGSRGHREPTGSPTWREPTNGDSNSESTAAERDSIPRRSQPGGKDACHAGARLESACEVVGLSPRTLQRWREAAGLREDARAAAAQERSPANRLRDAEREPVERPRPESGTDA
jgi:hypothetical protein